MKILLRTNVAVLLMLGMAVARAPAAVVLVEPGHSVQQLVDSAAPLHPSQPALDMVCALGNAADIESIGIDAATGTLYVQLADAGAPSVDSCIFSVSGTVPGVVTLVNPSTGFGINQRGTDLDFDPITGLLVTMDVNSLFSPRQAERIATVVPAFPGMTGTYSLLSPAGSFFGGTFGMAFSAGLGGGDVPAGDVVFTADVGGNGIHSAALSGLASTLHATPAVPGDDMVIQPNGDWVHVPDFNGVITAYSPVPPHTATPSSTGLNIASIFQNAGLSFQCGSRATSCGTTGDLYVSYSCPPGGTGIFRVDAGLTTATHVLTISGPEGLQDLTLGQSTSGGGNSVYFTVHDLASSGEEVWELTVPECFVPCDPDPRTQGYWHRQCLGIPASQGGLDPGRNGRGPQRPTEPGFDSDLMPCVERTVRSLGLSLQTCEGLDADPRKDACEKAIKQLTALTLNVCSDRLQTSCEVDLSNHGCSSTQIGDLLQELVDLVLNGECKQAADCAAAVNEGYAILP